MIRHKINPKKYSKYHQNKQSKKSNQINQSINKIINNKILYKFNQIDNDLIKRNQLETMRDKDRINVSKSLELDKKIFGFSLIRNFKKTGKIEINKKNGCALHQLDIVLNITYLCIKNSKDKYLAQKQILSIIQALLHEIDSDDYPYKIYPGNTFLYTYNLEVVSMMFKSKTLSFDRLNLSQILKMILEEKSTKKLTNKYKAPNNYWINLLKFLIGQGICGSNDQTENNTLSLAIQTCDLMIIREIIKTNPLPHNYTNEFMYYNYNYDIDLSHHSLTCAVNTMNLEIVRIALKLGAKPNIMKDPVFNTLILAILKLEPLIVREIMMSNGYLISTSWGENQSINTIIYMIFTKMIDVLILSRDQVDYHKIEHIINLIMCYGIQINESSYQLISYKLINKLGFFDNNLAHKIQSKFESCYKLLNHIDFDSKHELINSLGEIMRTMMNQNRTVIDNLLHNKLPECLIDVICNYERESKTQYINWYKYN